VTLQKQIKKLEHYQVHDRSSFSRLGALVLTAATILSMVNESHDASKQLRRDIMVNSNFIASPAEKNETVRSPIKFDDGLRATATTGA
jgi:hypothetical protein